MGLVVTLWHKGGEDYKAKDRVLIQYFESEEFPDFEYQLVDVNQPEGSQAAEMYGVEFGLYSYAVTIHDSANPNVALKRYSGLQNSVFEKDMKRLSQEVAGSQGSIIQSVDTSKHMNIIIIIALVAIIIVGSWWAYKSFK